MYTLSFDASASSLDQLELFPVSPVPSTRHGLAALGVEVAMSWSAVGRSPARPLLPLREVLRWSAKLSDASLQEALALVASHLEARGFSDISAVKIKRDVGEFISVLHALDLRSLRAVTPADVEVFLYGAVKGRGHENYREPSTAVVTSRRTAVRTLYMTARVLGLADGDPTLDIRIAPRRTRSARVFTDEEQMLGQFASRMSFFDTRGPTIWALGQATAMPAEMGRVEIADVDLERARVRLSGTKDRNPRWGHLTPWGAEQIAARITDLDGDPSRWLVYEGKGGLSRADSSITNKLVDIFTIAGIHEQGVRPSSLVAWAGRQVFNETHQIEDAAKALGVDSLDRAAKLIGWGWRDDAASR